MSLLLFKEIRKNSVRNSLKAFSAVFLLLFYIAGNIPVEVFHQLVHAHDTTAHTAHDEKDPCHRTIYHADKDNNCAHAHLTKVKKCNLCNLISHTDQLTVSVSSYPCIPSYFSHDAFTILSRSGDIVTALPSRGPPSLFILS